jgi:hypothetical protein
MKPGREERLFAERLLRCYERFGERVSDWHPATSWPYPGRGGEARRLLVPAAGAVRYAAALFCVLLAEAAQPEIHTGTSVVLYSFAVWVPARYCGAGPAWLAAATALAALAWELPPANSFAIAPEFYWRFLGNGINFWLLVTARPSTLRGDFRRLVRPLARQRSRRNTVIIASINVTASASLSGAGRPSVAARAKYS